MIYKTKDKSGHPGGSLSMVEILSQLYLRHMKHDPSYPNWEDRDRFILSKGHGVPALYSLLAYTGYFEPDELLTLRQINSRLQGHPDIRVCPGIEASTGALGQGLSIGVGHALAGRMDERDYRTYVLMGDGEIQEGQVWEAAMFAGSHKLSNLTAIVDANGFQLDAAVEDVLSVEPLAEKWASFGWATHEVDGHDVNALEDAFEWVNRIEDKPTVLIARTVKGKGVSYMENNNSFHGVVPTDEEYAIAMKELEAPEKQQIPVGASE